MITAYIGIGANLGDRAKTLCSAAAELGKREEIRLIAASPVYETAPVGVADQPDFLNAVLQVETDLPGRALLDLLLEVERAFGRVRNRKWEARTLDLDVLLYGGAVIREEGLEVPHPHLHTRAFVLLPLCDLNADGCHPVLGRTFRDLARSICAEQRVQRVEGISLLPACRRG